MNQYDTSYNAEDLLSPAASRSSDLGHDDLPDNEPGAVETAQPPQSKHAYHDPPSSFTAITAAPTPHPSRPPSPTPHPAFLASPAALGGRAPPPSGPPPLTPVLRRSTSEEDPADLAAAVALLSYSYDTPKSGPTAMPADISPLLPPPAKYQGALVSSPESGMFNSGQQHDVDLEHMWEEDVHAWRHHRHEDEDEGMSGRMDISISGVNKVM